MREYGSWPSPITSDRVAAAGTGSSMLPREIRSDNEDLYWIEFRPSEARRHAIMHRDSDGHIQCITPTEFNVASRVHEYGGGAYAVHEGTLYFVNLSDQAIYIQAPGEPPRLLTQPASDTRTRYADLEISPDGRWLVAVRERHTAEDVINDLVAVTISGEWKIIQLASGCDFYASPRFDPPGDRLCWLSWNHPNMPWDGTRLSLARFDDGRIQDAVHVAGSAEESIYQPAWSPDGLLYFVSDRSGWWNLYRMQAEKVAPVLPMQAEFGRPAWLFGYSSYAFLSADEIAAAYKVDGEAALGIIKLESGKLQRIETELNSFELPSIAAGAGGQAWFMAGSACQPPGLVRLDPATGTLERIDGPDSGLPENAISKPQHLAYPSASGRHAYAYYYTPCNPAYAAPVDGLPPLIVTAHGGPTSSARPHFDLEVQFWTSRGFALLDVDYAGSTGYGRAYRRSLDGQWGKADVEDCVHAARYAVDHGLAAPGKLLIRGRSAGGFLVLAALTFFDAFSAGASYFGIGDLETLALHTHKFEAHYMDRLVGPLPEAEAIYRARSPLAHLDRLSRPVILFQGLDDPVVPPVLAEQIAGALENKQLPYALLTFPGEGHGFKKQETITRALEAELEFYQRILDLPRLGLAERLKIHNFPAQG